MEEDFAALYPDLAASMVMNRDSLVSVARTLQSTTEKIARYEAQMEGEAVVRDAHNNMLSLSGQHAAFAPLAGADVREKFLGFLYDMDPPVRLLNDRNFMVSQWVAFNKDPYLKMIEGQGAATTAAATAAATARRRSVGDTTGARPAIGPATPVTVLDEMVSDFFER